MSSLRSNLLTAVMVACAVTVTSLAVRKQLKEEPSPQRVSAGVWAELVSHGRWIGDSLAAVRIVEFADFQCTYCADLAPRLNYLVDSNSGNVAVLYRHFPLTRIHRHAMAAALASECAATLGMFKQAHDALFTLQDSIGVLPWSRFLGSSDTADTAAFTKCLTNAPQSDRVERDLRLANQLGLPGTPVLVVEGRVLLGRDIDNLESVVRALTPVRKP